MGGEERVKRQHDRGKLTARERLARVLSTTASTSRSACTARRWASSAGPMGATIVPPPDAVVICAFGKVDGPHGVYAACL